LRHGVTLFPGRPPHRARGCRARSRDRGARAADRGVRARAHRPVQSAKRTCRWRVPSSLGVCPPVPGGATSTRRAHRASGMLAERTEAATMPAKKNKKGPTKGSGGKNRRSLEGKGGTLPAEQRHWYEGKQRAKAAKADSAPKGGAPKGGVRSEQRSHKVDS